MIVINEKLSGKVKIDVENKRLQIGGRTVIAVDDITAAAVCKNVKVVFGKKENAAAAAAVVGLELKIPVAQPGRRSLSKSEEIILAFENADEAVAALKAVGVFFSEETEPENFDADKCVVEAKRGCCDYTRAGTVGANPYGKAGIVSAVIVPTLRSARGEIEIKYLGTTSRLHKSEYFAADPVQIFDIKKADTADFFITARGGKYTAEAEFKRSDIERDENAEGLWYLSAEKDFDSLCSALNMLSVLERLQSGEIVSKPQLSELSREEKSDLENMLHRLNAVGLLTDEELEAKIVQLSKK